ncbi:hypothetical protein TNCV_2258311 [Trichonephila clavipes]|nr:hypothetical protein TNCV_2258311 [Trichonephila clavipes]
MDLTAWLHFRWIEGTTTAAREGSGSLCTARVTNEGGFGLDTFRLKTSILAITPKRSSLSGSYYWFI